jgi:hypothetical protein
MKIPVFPPKSASLAKKAPTPESETSFYSRHLFIAKPEQGSDAPAFFNDAS